jgi:hypothetical protein
MEAVPSSIRWVLGEIIIHLTVFMQQCLLRSDFASHTQPLINDLIHQSTAAPH